MMELNEEIEEENDVELLKKKSLLIEDEIQKLLHNFGEMFKKKRLEEAKRNVNRIRYYKRSLNLVSKKLGRMTDD